MTQNAQQHLLILLVKADMDLIACSLSVLPSCHHNAGSLKILTLPGLRFYSSKKRVPSPPNASILQAREIVVAYKLIRCGE
jgi:hypothetical protein